MAEYEINPFISDEFVIFEISDYYCVEADFVREIIQRVVDLTYTLLIAPNAEVENADSDPFLKRHLESILVELANNGAKGRVEKQGEICHKQTSCIFCNRLTVTVRDESYCYLFSISNLDFPTPKSYSKISELITQNKELHEVEIVTESFTGGAGLGLTMTKKLLSSYQSSLDFNITNKNTEFSFRINKSYFGIKLESNEQVLEGDAFTLFNT